MASNLLEGKLARAREAWDLLSSYADGLAAKATMARAYARIFSSTTDRTEVDLRLKIAGQSYPFRMRLMDLFTVAEILHERQYELASALPKAPIIIDGGANIGVATLYFHACHPGATIHAFEPEPENFRILAHNVRGLRGVKAIHAALGASSDPVQLRLAAHGAEHSVHDARLGEQTVEVPCVRLDRHLEHEGLARIDLLKLDVEGSEAEVVEGLGEQLSHVGVMVGEMHERLVDAPALYRRLEQAGFRRVREVRYRDAEAEGVHAFELVRASP